MHGTPAPTTEEQVIHDDDAARRRAIGRTAGILFSAGAVASVPANQLFVNPPAPSYAHLITGLAFLSGLVCFVLPWHRVRPGWFELIPAVATLEVALTVWSIRPHVAIYSWFFVFVAVFVGYAFRSRRSIGIHLVFVCAAFALPIGYLDEGQRTAIVQTVVSIPILVLTGVIVAALRERLEEGQQALRELADRDALTAVGNYRLLSERLRYELARHRRHKREFAVVLLDLDGFKEVNEQFGHLAGDRVLREVGQTLRGAVRDQDTVARQGGDEFSVLAPETGLEEVESLVPRLRRALAGIAGARGPMTASIGWAIYPRDGERQETLLAHADSVARGDKAARRDPALQANEPPLRLVTEAERKAR